MIGFFPGLPHRRARGCRPGTGSRPRGASPQRSASAIPRTLVFEFEQNCVIEQVTFVDSSTGAGCCGLGRVGSSGVGRRNSHPGCTGTGPPHPAGTPQPELPRSNPNPRSIRLPRSNTRVAAAMRCSSRSIRSNPAPVRAGCSPGRRCPGQPRTGLDADADTDGDRDGYG